LIVDADNRDSQVEALETRNIDAVLADICTPAARASRLSRRGASAAIWPESAILRLVACGQSNKEIARNLGIDTGAVKNQVSYILRKLEAWDRAHAVLKPSPGTFCPEAIG
jgi:ATP/maltotriose-dependent transcriptional regulator MalT